MSDLVPTLDCLQLTREFNALVGLGCCLSCHDDADNWGYDLLEGWLLDGRRVSVCCRMHEELLRLGMLGDEP